MIDLGNGLSTSGRLPTLEEKAKSWRNTELKNTDWVVSVTDHPQHSEYLVYRQALRDWPESEDFPTVKPEL